MRTKCHENDLFRRRSVQLIKNHNISTPLFLYVPFQAPHEPIQEPPKKYLKLYSSNARNRLGRNFNRAATISVSYTLIKTYFM